ncbi:hypothetical protein ABIC60_000011 [Phyllobacterium ifriqiyense]
MLDCMVSHGESGKGFFDRRGDDHVRAMSTDLTHGYLSSGAETIDPFYRRPEHLGLRPAMSVYRKNGRSAQVNLLEALPGRLTRIAQLGGHTLG